MFRKLSQHSSQVLFSFLVKSGDITQFNPSPSLPSTHALTEQGCALQQDTLVPTENVMGKLLYPKVIRPTECWSRVFTYTFQYVMVSRFLCPGVSSSESEGVGLDELLSGSS
jgi:hypothetical protein